MNWTWVAASCRGTSHIKAKTRGQDHARCLLLGDRKETLAVVVSDGAGSAKFGGGGSSIVCRTLVQSARAHFAATHELPDDEQIWGWIDETRDCIGRASEARGVLPRDFAATLVAALITEDECLLLHIGDGAPVVRTANGWVSPSWPSAGEYASMTFFVTDDPVPQLRVTRMPERVEAVAAFTDGIERLALDFGRRQPHVPFFDGVMRPLAATVREGRDGPLTAALKSYLDSDAINARTDDDKTLVLAVRK